MPHSCFDRLLVTALCSGLLASVPSTAETETADLVATARLTLVDRGWQLDGGARSTDNGLRVIGTGEIVPPWPATTVQEATTVLRPLARANGGGFAVTGLRIGVDSRSFWVVQLVETPDGSHYVELGEMLAGAWQAQTAAATKLEYREGPNDGLAWEYGRDYRFTIALEHDRVRATVTTGDTGQALFAGAYEFGAAPAVMRGRPSVWTQGVDIVVSEVSRTRPQQAPGKGTDEGTGRVLILSGDGPRSPGGTAAEPLARELRAAGLEVLSTGQEGLGDASLLDPVQTRLVILCDSSYVLEEHAGRFQRYASAGGALITIGAAPFGDTVYELEDDWRSLRGWASSPRLLNHAQRRVLFGFGQDLGGEWVRGSDRLDEPGTVRRVSEGDQWFARIETRHVASWDTYAVDLPDLSGAAPGSCLHLRARNTDGMTPELAVELVESDGSRWIATAEIGRDWTDLLLPPSAFVFWQSVPGRGGPDDHVRLDRAVRLSIGLAVTHVPVIGPAHVYDIDEVAVVPDLLSGAVTARDLDAGIMIRTYAEDRVKDLPRVAATPGTDTVFAGLELKGRFSGVAALPLLSPQEGSLVPLVSAFDDHNRRRLDLGCAVHYRTGLFAGSTRVAFTCTNQDLFEKPEARSRLVELCRRLLDRQEPTPGPRLPEHRGFVAEAESFAGDMPRIRVSDDGQRLETVDGRTFFAIGANYHGYFDRCWNEYLDDTYAPDLIEADFRKLRAAGVNTLRLFFYRLGNDIRAGDWGKIDGVLDAARRHGLYLLVHLYGHDSTEMSSVLEVNRALVRHLSGNPVVLGYDLRNEPTILIMNRFSYPPERKPLAHGDYLLRHAGPGAERIYDQRPLPDGYSPEFSEVEHAHAVVFDRLFAQYAAQESLYASTFRNDPFKPLDDPLWRHVRHVAEDLLDTYITLQAGVVREEDPEALVTVGHNWAVDFLDANRHLDFISHHVYQRPRTHEFVLDNLYTFDALRRKWPTKPISYGEFGYTNGLGTVSGENLDTHSSAVGEFLHYLYPLAKGYSGSYKWMANDPTALRVSSPYEHMFGFFAYDGTLYGRAKPICYATRMLARYVDRYGVGGRLEIREESDPMPVGYVFHGEGGTVFAGGPAYAGDALVYDNGRPTNVMLLPEADGRVRVMASPDCRVRLRTGTWIPPGDRIEVSGLLGSQPRDDGDWLELELLDGEEVILHRDPGQNR